MAWVKDVLTGIEFTIEAINMMCFIMEEAAQTAMMAHSMALQNLQMNLAEEIRNETIEPCLNKLFEYWSTYALPIMPNSNAWLCFFWAYKLYVLAEDERVDNYKRLLALGIDPRPGKNKTKP